MVRDDDSGTASGLPQVFAAQKATIAEVLDAVCQHDQASCRVAEIEATEDLSIVTPDADADAVLSGFAAQVEALSSEVIGSASVDLCLERIPGLCRTTLNAA